MSTPELRRGDRERSSGRTQAGVFPLGDAHRQSDRCAASLSSMGVLVPLSASA